MNPTVQQDVRLVFGVMAGEATQDPFTIEAYGTFTPPPPPCGNDACEWQEQTDGWVVIHNHEDGD